jgi:hypothetical protein
MSTDKANDLEESEQIEANRFEREEDPQEYRESMRQQMLAQGNFLAGEREADGTEKTEDEGSQVTGKLTAGPSARTSEAFSEQVQNPQSRAPTDLRRDDTQRDGDSQIDSSAKDDELFGVKSSLADGAAGDHARLENQDTEFSMQNQSEAFFRDRVIDENAQII